MFWVLKFFKTLIYIDTTLWLFHYTYFPMGFQLQALTFMEKIILKNNNAYKNPLSGSNYFCVDKINANRRLADVHTDIPVSNFRTLVFNTHICCFSCKCFLNFRRGLFGNKIYFTSHINGPP